MNIRLVLSALTLLAAALLPDVVRAQNIDCNFVPANPVLEFGTVPVDPTPATETTASVGVHCAGTSFGNPGPVKACLKLTSGSPDTSLLPYRKMANGGARMDYQISRDPAHAQVWGDASGVPAGEMVITLRRNGLFSYEGTGYATLYGRIRSGQIGLPTGNYNSTMNMRLTASFNTNDSCASLNSPIDTDLPVTAHAYVASSCTVDAADLGFGLHSRLDQAPIEVATAIGINCTLGTAYTVRLERGTSSGSSMSKRRMALNGAGPGVVEYELRRDGYNGAPWGDGTAGTSVVTGTGTGSSRTLTVYGVVPVQTTPPVGRYEDTVTATVVY